jgi:hypothetical protein
MDAICHAARAHLDWVHPNRAPAFNPPHKAGKHCSAFCSEEEGIPTSSDIFRSAAKNALMRGTRILWLLPGVLVTIRRVSSGITIKLAPAQLIARISLAAGPCRPVGLFPETPYGSFRSENRSDVLVLFDQAAS